MDSLHISTLHLPLLLAFLTFSAYVHILQDLLHEQINFNDATIDLVLTRSIDQWYHIRDNQLSNLTKTPTTTSRSLSNTVIMTTILVNHSLTTRHVCHSYFTHCLDHSSLTPLRCVI